MARTARRRSISGYYHLIIRGNSRQILFEDREDHVFFLSLLKRYSAEEEVSVCAYCLMENHVHLLVQDTQDHKARLMHRIEMCYAGYFNEKYDRCGHLFQGRYRSEEINSERYLITVFCYILNNPVNAGLCAADQYEWSSYPLYGSTRSFVDTSTLCQMIGDPDHYRRLIGAGVTEACSEYDKNTSLTDAQALALIQRRLGGQASQTLQHFAKKDRNDALRSLKQAGLSCRQIERLTGIGRGIVQRA